mmetsp:Transcript_28729/g.29064  ORF Transcript_28729/g.29064 Transcript_28729/m.29064 type:complete len:262 (-) Transcript_28729:290-1075(-)|eukprot:CAMPEP_0182420788 /NCGR_PEP_ID=MMETSP1167-20130531/5863_1 /TAXON_ID=2988 /ORGANISM="Mallomonas Sp, Strain CCMP3275" /LENGTH=261 /DNA_ID=CAMNT_0024597239 /DNA_START=67 /DNA_END=852 /DNA_ORIENTATION=-
MSKLFSLSDLNKKQEEEEKKQEYYAGGNDSRTGGGSGLSVVDPNDPRRRNAGSSGDTLSRIVNNASTSSAESTPQSGGRRVTLYRNGFTVDDGNLRDLESPESRRFLAALAEGYVPQELMQDNSTRDVALELSDKRTEDYVPPPQPAYVAFAGEAMSLGGASPSGAVVVTPDMIPTSGIPEVDVSVPVTTLQVKLISGKKVKIRVNHSHTVLHLIGFLNREEAASRPFILSAGFPPKDITDTSKSVSEAGLVGASITQKAA